jgi:sodium-dependent dicarboxylate transporter 2/3/5
VLLALAWAVLALLYPSKSGHFEVGMKPEWHRSRPARIYYVTAAVTILLWVTEALHGINSYIVGLVPVTVLLATRVFDTKDFQSLDWHVLWLVAGGIALGVGVAETGFDRWIVGLIDWSRLSPTLLAGMMALAALTLGTFISHSAATNLLAPMAMAVATSTQSSHLAAVAFVAIGSSVAMALPISTPPNAIAFSSRAIKTKDMALAGAIIGAVGWVILFFLLPPLMKLAGVL